MNSGERVEDVPINFNTWRDAMPSQSKQTAQIHPTNKAVMRLSKDMGTKSIELSNKDTYSIGLLLILFFFHLYLNAMRVYRYSPMTDKQIAKRETRFAWHLPKTDYRDDYHYVKELVTYTDGSTEPRTYFLKDYKRNH